MSHVDILGGERIGRYELRKLLGQGAFGLVFGAHDTELDRDVALKILMPEHTFHPEHMKRFFQEARAAAKIEHPSIVTIHECGKVNEPGTQFDGSPYIAMEMVRGESVAARLAQIGRFHVAHAIDLGREVASALAAAHRTGIIHRDLKPDNLMLAKDPVAPRGERIKVLDFGIAKLAEAAAQHPQMHTGHVVFGTAQYMSPEQFRSTGTVDRRTDIYALGIILFQLITGRLPFEGDFVEMLELHSSGVRPALRSYVPDVPAWLESLVNSMIASDMSARPGSMEEVERALARTATSQAFAPTMAPAMPPTIYANDRRRATTLRSATGSSDVDPTDTRWKLWAGVVSAVVLGTIVVVAVSLGGGSTAPDAGPAPAAARPATGAGAGAPPAEPPPAPPAAVFVPRRETVTVPPPPARVEPPVTKKPVAKPVTKPTPLKATKKPAAKAANVPVVQPEVKPAPGSGVEPAPPEAKPEPKPAEVKPAPEVTPPSGDCPADDPVCTFGKEGGQK